MIVWAKEKKEYLENLIGQLSSLLDTIKHAKSKICVYPSPTYKALTQLNTSRRKASLMSRRKKENVRKACNRKGKEWNRLRKALFTYKLCFPEGYITVKEANIQSAAMHGCVRLCTVIYVYARQFAAIYGHVQLCTAIQSYEGLCRVI